MEVKIGVQYAARELVVESAQTPDEVSAEPSPRRSTAGGVLTLADDAGPPGPGPVEKLAYVEIGETDVRRVGFGAM